MPRTHLKFSDPRLLKAPFRYRDRTALEMVSSGVAEIDSFIGGFPRGALTEICGPSCSGRTSLFLAALAARTAQNEICGLVDGSDNFDPVFARSAGVRLEQLLWVRCSKLEQALRSADLLMQAGGFGFIALDLSDVPPRLVRQIPLNVWFRFRRAVEDTPTVLLVLEQDASAKTCASLVLRFVADSARWQTTQPDREPASRYPAACLLSGLSIRMEVLRSRVRSSVGSSVGPVIEFSPSSPAARPGALKTEIAWNIPNSRAATP